MTVRRVLGNRILVRTVQSETALDEVEKKGLLYVPETVKDANRPLPIMGMVVQLGEALTFDNEEEKPEVGDIVLFSKFSGTDLRMNENDYRIMEVREIMAVLDVETESVEPVVREEQGLAS